MSARVLRASNGDTYESPQLQELELQFAFDGVLEDIEKEGLVVGRGVGAENWEVYENAP